MLIPSDTKIKKKCLLLWSGGYDSTSLLLDLLENGHEVRALTIISDQVNDDQQVVARAFLWKEISKVFSFKSVQYNMSTSTRQIPLGLDHSFEGICGSGAQPLMWLSIGSLCLQPEEDLVLGWVRGDDVWHSFHEIRKIFDTINWYQDKKANLVAPYEWCTKDMIYNNITGYEDYVARQGLFKAELKLFDHCWCCQDSRTSEPCNMCVSCDKHNQTIFKLSSDEKSRLQKDKKPIWTPKLGDISCQMQKSFLNRSLVPQIQISQPKEQRKSSIRRKKKWTKQKDKK